MSKARENNQAWPLDVFTCPLDGVSNIEASAGTGKTWAICGLYLRLIVEMDLKADRILVVTFTNAATAELKSRIRQRIAETLRVMETGRCLAGDPFAEKFLQRIRQLEGGVAGQARDRLQAALFSFDEASIFTIHSFCQRTLGDMPFAAAQPFELDVEADDGDVIREAAADYWRRIVERYGAEDIRALQDEKIDPDRLAREFKRILDKPTARLVLPAVDAHADRPTRRAAWLKRLLLRVGPPAIRAAKRHRRMISYNDMLYNLYDVLVSGRFPSLAATLQQRYPAALIDEFQDTDPLQYAIFHSIYSKGGSLFLVGDPKQAIYSFRNADLNTYLAAKRDAKRQWTLAENQRSEPGLIQAVNAVFEANANAFCSSDIPYQRVKRGVKSIKNLTGDAEERAPLSVWYFEPGSKNAPIKTRDAEKRALEAAVHEIARLIEAGGRGWMKIGDAPLQPHDIAVLVRTRRQGREVKEALAQVGIGSVDLTDRSVFATLDALEMERVMRAVAQPARTGLVRAALSTVFLGKKSGDLDALSLNEAAFNDIVERMHQYRRIWLQSGFGVMWRKLLAEEQVIERLLPQAGGERRITNLMHLMELTAAAEETHPGVESLLRMLCEKRADTQNGEAALLRLESDENLVQIVTKHRAKGLEWPIVFCPFIWKDGGGSKEKSDVFTYHLEDDLILDYEGGDQAKKRQEEEGRADRVRLIYVALTRAVNRCYIAAGPFWQPSGRSATESAARKSMMNWIVAGNAETPGDWVENKKTTVASMRQAWDNLLASGMGVGRIPWPAGKAVSLTDAEGKKDYRAGDIKRIPETAWRVSSYSTLAASSFHGGVLEEQEARDYDMGSAGGKDRSEEEPPSPAGLPSPDILDFPAGVTAGHCLHAVFERIDFQDDGRWQNVIDDVLCAYPPGDAEGRAGEHAGMIRRMLSDVLTAKLPGGFSLRDVRKRKRLTEFEFTFPVGRLDSAALNALLSRFGRHVPRLTFPALEGYLRGFMDLVFEADGKWYVLDWKSNKTGTRAEDYSRHRLHQEMFHHAYELQGLIYLTALHRYLKSRIPEYDYRVHIGGMIYLFVRGVKPAWPSAGIWHDLPEAALIESLDALFYSQGGPAGDGA